LVVIGALAYFGVLSPSNLLPEKCTFPVSLNCLDYGVSANEITFVFQNGAGRDMTVRRVNVTSDALSVPAPPTPSCGNGTNIIIRNGLKATFVLNNCAFFNTGRDKNRYNVNVTYNWMDSSANLEHVITGELLAKRP
jgi:hypothetical protein